MRFWRDLPVSRKLGIVIGTMACLIALELLTLRFSMNILSAARGFVGGESTWSKAQKNASLHIQRYAYTKNEADFRAFLKEFEVSNGDHRARLELEKPKPDYARIRQGFVAGKIHPDDVSGLASLVRNLYWEHHVAEAIKTWVEGDRLMGEFKSAGIRLKQAMNVRRPDPKRIAATRDELRKLDTELTGVEERFSTVLGAGSRWLEGFVNTILCILVLTVEAVGLTLTFLTSRSLSRGLRAINSTAEEIGKGEFGMRVQVESNDEVGQVGRAVNRMAAMLEVSYRDLENRVAERTRELARMVDKNAELYSRAREAVMMRDEFLSIASHELKTPLTALQLNVELLSRRLAEVPSTELEQARGLADGSLRDSRRLVILLDELLDLTRIRMGKLELRRERCNLASVAMDVLSQFSAEAARAGCTLSLESSGPVLGYFDSLRVSQVLTNLVSNAIKYGAGKPIRIGVRENGRDSAELSVLDQGVGVPAEDRTRIFERFERASGAERASGLGLGLYIARQIALNHGGDIRVEDGPKGRGSRFVVELSRAEPTQAAAIEAGFSPELRNPLTESGST